MDTYHEVLVNARQYLGKYCKGCDICNGKACRNAMPGPGAKGLGEGAIHNYEAWKAIRINMDTIHDNQPVDVSLTLLNQHFEAPIFAGPVGAVNLHYGDSYDDLSYNQLLVSACAEAGIAAFTGDGTNPEVMISACLAIATAEGRGVPTVKPWNMDTIRNKLKLVNEARPFAVAMDVDAAGLPFLKNMTPPAGSKSVDELHEIIELLDVPFIVKGVMSVNGALKAQEAGADAIIVSNHGGRVLDQVPATAEVLADIVDAVGDDMKILVDGGIRDGIDVFKALALGADAVVIARPFVNAIYGGGAEGVKLYVDKLVTELKDTMSMCGASSLEDINRQMLFKID